MGCDIHTYVETNVDGAWCRIEGEPFEFRIYDVFGFLADVRNYSKVPPLAVPRGLPLDVSDEVRREYDRWEPDAHSCSWFSVDALAAFDYDAEFEDRYGGRTVTTTYRKFLGPQFFADLDMLRGLNGRRPTRLVFWFDN